jgi:hypothetical protein
MARKLNLVRPGDSAPVEQHPLRCKQLLVSPLPDGSSALLMVSMDDKVYILGNEGWLAYNMMEAFDATSV